MAARLAAAPGPAGAAELLERLAAGAAAAAQRVVDGGGP